MRPYVPGFIFILSVTFFSCKKEHSQATGFAPGTKILLTKIISDIPGRFIIDSFVYDSRGRCSQLYSIVDDSTMSMPVNHYVKSYEFHYHGNDSLPYKVDMGGDIWWIEYDSEGRKILDSMTYALIDLPYTYHYSYSSNRIFANSSYFDPGIRQWDRKDTFDLESSNIKRHGAFFVDFTHTSYWQHRFTYDSYNNPISTLNISKAIFFGSLSTVRLYEGLNKNNILSHTVTTPAGQGNVVTYQYVYNSDAYPISTYFFSATAPRYTGRIKYEYNK